MPMQERWFTKKGLNDYLNNSIRLSVENLVYPKDKNLIPTCFGDDYKHQLNAQPNQSRLAQNRTIA